VQTVAAAAAQRQTVAHKVLMAVLVAVAVVRAQAARAFLAKATRAGHQTQQATVVAVAAQTQLAVTAAAPLAVMVAQVRATPTTAPTRHTRAVAAAAVR